MNLKWIIAIFLIFIIYAMPVQAANATSLVNITVTSQSTATGTNATYLMNLTNNGTSGGDSYYINISNPNSASVASANISFPVYVEQDASRIFSLNVTNTSTGIFYVNVTVLSVNDTTKNMSVNTTTTVYDLPGITTYSPNTPVTDANAVISRIFSVTVNQSATVTYYLGGTNVGSTVGTTVTYTNSTPTLGTWNVTAIATTGAGSASQTWTWIVPSSTISSASVVTGTGSSDRIINSANVSMNFTFTDSGNISTINLTFPSTFKFGALLANNVTTGIGTCTLTFTSTVISCYNASGLNNTATYINLTVNVTTPSASGTNAITISTNKNTTGTNVSLYVRDSTRPFYVKSNNSVFTVVSETFGTSTTTITLSGTGVSNLTLYAPNITGQTNITAGYGATYVDSIRTVHTLTTTPNNTIYLITNGTIANPVIVVSSEQSLYSSNLPAAITAAGVISGLAVVYAYLRRRRRH